eukprot:scaffold111786_cov63-Phaeocystis_antarctica.AAC.2
MYRRSISPVHAACPAPPNDRLAMLPDAVKRTSAPRHVSVGGGAPGASGRAGAAGRSGSSAASSAWSMAASGCEAGTASTASRLKRRSSSHESSAPW